MLITLLALAALVWACAALVRRARRIGGYQAAADPYEAEDDDAIRAELAERFNNVWVKAGGRLATTVPAQPRPLPRRPRKLPPHVDPPLTPEQLAHVRDRWPHMVSSLLRDSAKR